MINKWFWFSKSETDLQWNSRPYQDQKIFSSWVNTVQTEMAFLCTNGNFLPEKQVNMIRDFETILYGFVWLLKLMRFQGCRKLNDKSIEYELCLLCKFRIDIFCHDLFYIHIQHVTIWLYRCHCNSLAHNIHLGVKLCMLICKSSCIKQLHVNIRSPMFKTY